MAENARAPVAVRVVRPYETEEALLESELETIGRTSVILIGAQSRPTGVILRFEVALASGTTVLRGEGRVLAHKESAFRGQPGLALRFTRLDPRSKALVDRAAAMRDVRLAGDSTRPAAPPPSIAPMSSPPRSSPSSERAPPRTSWRASTPATPRTSTPPDPALAEVLTTPTPTPPPPIPPPPPATESEPEAAAPEEAAAAPDGVLSDRDALLSRLRRRAASLTEAQRAAILRRQS